MSRTMTVKANVDYAEVEDGEYAATVTKIEDLDTQYGPAYKIHFDLGDGITLTGLCNVPDNFSPKSKVYQWYCAAMGVKELDEDEEVDIDAMIGRKCRVLVEQREGKERTWATVTKVMPLRAKKAAPKTSDQEIDDM